MTTNNRPSHIVWLVEGEGDTAKWTEIGVLWPHKKGEGFTQELKAIPLTGRLVILPRRDKSEKEGA